MQESGGGQQRGSTRKNAWFGLEFHINTKKNSESIQSKTKYETRQGQRQGGDARKKKVGRWKIYES